MVSWFAVRVPPPRATRPRGLSRHRRRALTPPLLSLPTRDPAAAGVRRCALAARAPARSHVPPDPTLVVAAAAAVPRSTLTSTVAAFAKRGDLVIVDAGVHEPLRTGLTLSRANVKEFAHNDLDDLEVGMISCSFRDDKRWHDA